MNDFDQFERRLAAALRSDADLSVAAFEPGVIARAAIGGAQRRASRPARRFGGRRGTTLLAAAALLLVGGAMAAGSGLLRLPSVVPPEPAPSLAAVVPPSPAADTPSPATSPSPAPTATPVPVPPRAPSWAAAVSMITPRSFFAAVSLLDGRVLVVGGSDGSKNLASVELYDPATGTWTATGSMLSHAGRPYGAAYGSGDWGGDRFTTTLLRDGKVLVAGGNSAELYDPATGTWASTGSMASERSGHTATLLTDGKVLVAGDDASAELYDPMTGTWTATGSMLYPRELERHGATLLSDGKVLVTSGKDPAGYAMDWWSASAELYDPGTGTWSATGSMVQGGRGSPLLLPDGRVLVISAPPELYDPGSGSWTPIGGSLTAGFNGPGVVLGSGGVLALGSEDSSTKMAAYLFDPGANSWTPAGQMAVPRVGYTATLLPDGRVLVAGGSDASGALASAELFDPSTWSPSR